MSTDVEPEGPAVASFDELVDLLKAGEKPPTSFRVGGEFESLPYLSEGLGPVPYERIRFLLEGIADRFGYEIIAEAGLPMALRKDGRTITLEPGGQLELSGAPYPSLHEIEAELNEHLRQVEEIAETLGIRLSFLGLRPLERVTEMPWMPRARHRAMGHYLPQYGRDALTMMLLSSSVQANFDFADEQDMAEKMRCAMAMAPVVAAVSANSPYEMGRWTGYRSRRYAAWRRVDPARCGLIERVFDDDFGYSAYAEYAMDAPLLFLRRRGQYLSLPRVTFREFFSKGLNGERATLGDFKNHLSGLFPEVRLKTCLEVRSADNLPPKLAMAMIALWKGILYDRESRERVLQLMGGFAFADRLAMQRAAAQDGLLGHGPGWHLGELAAELFRFGADGLARSERPEEAKYLQPLESIVAERRTLADALIEQFGSQLGADACRRALGE